MLWTPRAEELPTLPSVVGTPGQFGPPEVAAPQQTRAGFSLTAKVVGYWSDGTAGIEVVVPLHDTEGPPPGWDPAPDHPPAPSAVPW